MTEKLIHVAHGGHSGDITYSLPFAEYVSKHYGGKIIFHIISDRPVHFPEGMEHPNGNSTIMTKNAYEFISPLLKNLPYVEDVVFTKMSELNEGTIKLDYYRDTKGFNLGAGNIQTWARKWLGLDIKTEEPWIHLSDLKRTPKLICGFTQRYRNTAINYNFIDDLDSGFIGLKEEYEHFKEKNNLKKIPYIAINNALEMARIIGSANLYLGNQSFAFSIAEGLKVNRALEVCEICPNVIPSGKGAHDYLTQEALLNILIKNKINPKRLQSESRGSFTHYFK